MFSLQSFIMVGLKDAVGKLADYQVVLNATGWFEKGVLTEENLQEIYILIEEKNSVSEILPEDFPPLDMPTEI